MSPLPTWGWALGLWTPHHQWLEVQEILSLGPRTASCSRLVGKSSGPECTLQGALGFDSHKFEHPLVTPSFGGGLCGSD